MTSWGVFNGSAFAGLAVNSVFYNLLLGVAMLIARYGPIVPILAMAGSLAGKNQTPTGSGTLPTHIPLFIGLLAGIVLLVGALTWARRTPCRHQADRHVVSCRSPGLNPHSDF